VPQDAVSKKFLLTYQNQTAMMNKRNKIALLLNICLLSVFIGNAQQLDSVFTPPPPDKVY